MIETVQSAISVAASTVRKRVVEPATVRAGASLEADCRGAVADSPREASPASSVPPAKSARTTILEQLIAEREPDPDALERERLVPMGRWAVGDWLPRERVPA